jgi:hypothetical protein
VSNVPNVIRTLQDVKFVIESVAHLCGLERDLLPHSEGIGEVIKKLQRMAPEIPRPQRGTA